MTTLMLSPSLSEPEFSPSDFRDPLRDLPREAELPGLTMRKLINLPLINKKLTINKKYLLSFQCQKKWKFWPIGRVI